MKRRRQVYAAFLCIPLILLGCYPEGAEYIEDYDLVITNHDKAFDFGSVNTFALPDEVVKLTGNLIKGEDPEFIEDEYADIIINSIRENMEDKGWIEVLKDEDPDVIILPSAVSSTTFIWYYDWWYWDWWYPYYWWGWYYPYPIYGGSYTSGSVFIQMTYPDGITAADNIPVIWSAILNGLLEGDVDKIDDRIERGIDQAFDQSPYLDLDDD